MASINESSLGSQGVDSKGALRGVVERAVASGETYLDCGATQLGNKGVVCLSQLLSELPHQLRCVRLAENSIGDEGAQVLASVLRAGCSLTKLDLYNNNIGDTGAIALANAIVKEPCLRHLDLWSNRVAEEGVLSLVRAMCAPGSMLSSVLLNHNLMPPEAWPKVAQILVEDNGGVVPPRLFLEGNYVTELQRAESGSDARAHLRRLIDVRSPESLGEAEDFIGIGALDNRSALLTDKQVQEFIAFGYVNVTPNLPLSFHESVIAKLNKVYARGNPGGSDGARVTPHLKTSS